MSRFETDKTFALALQHDPNCCCDACRGLVEVLDKKVALLERDVEELNRWLSAEQLYGKEDANNLLRLDGRVGALEKQRAKSEGRNEVLDQFARDQATQAQFKATLAEGAASSAQGTASAAKKTATVGGIVLIIWQVLEQLPPVKAWLASLGG